MGLLKFIFIFIVVSWILRILFRLIVVRFLRRSSPFDFRQPEQSNYRQPESAVNIDFVPPKKRSEKDPGGDFIDYEEVK